MVLPSSHEIRRNTKSHCVLQMWAPKPSFSPDICKNAYMKHFATARMEPVDNLHVTYPVMHQRRLAMIFFTATAIQVRLTIVWLSSSTCTIKTSRRSTRRPKPIPTRIGCRSCFFTLLTHRHNALHGRRGGSQHLWSEISTQEKHK